MIVFLRNIPLYSGNTRNYCLHPLAPLLKRRTASTCSAPPAAYPEATSHQLAGVHCAGHVGCIIGIIGDLCGRPIPLSLTVPAAKEYGRSQPCVGSEASTTLSLHIGMRGAGVEVEATAASPLRVDAEASTPITIATSGRVVAIAIALGAHEGILRVHRLPEEYGGCRVAAGDGICRAKSGE